MAVPSARQVFLLCFFWCLGCGCSTTDASLYDDLEERQLLNTLLRSVRSDDGDDVELRDQEEDQVQDVYKRFLFHYSKARDSLGAIQHQSHSVHPLMRLLPKLSQRRKMLLLKI